jgi:hypothetical protein
MIFERLDILDRLHNIEEQVILSISQYFKPNSQILFDFIICLNKLGIPCRAMSVFWNDPTLRLLMGDMTIIGVSKNKINWSAQRIKEHFGKEIFLINIFEKTKSLPIWLRPPVEKIEQDKFQYLCNLYTSMTGDIINSEYLKQIVFETYGINPQIGNIFYFPCYFQDHIFFDAIFAFEQSPEGWERLFIERLITVFINALHLICRIYLNYTFAIRASIAAIMGRNMSHNIGSHAIWHLAEQLKNSRAYSNEEIKNFMLYLQRRMDFIAQVSTSSPSWCLTTSWNEFLNEFTEQKCLLDNIARSHLQSPTEPSMQIYEKKLMIKRNESSFSISIPHGQIGAQAFYVILEGLIRNAAKYGKVTNILEFTITIEDQWDDAGKGWRKDFYRVKISDNLITSRRVVDDLNHKLAQSIIDPDTGELKTGDWGMKEIKICAAYLRMIKQEEIDIKFKEWQNGNAAQPPIIEVKLENPQIINNEISGNLTYVLYLLRPKEALIVGMKPQENLHDDAFRQKGIDFLPDFKALQQQIAEGDIPRHNFLVLLGGEQVDWKWLQENLASLPYRILVTGENTIPNDKDYECLKRVMVFMKKDKLNLNEPEGLLQCLWENWVESWWGKYEVCIRWDNMYRIVRHNMYRIVRDDPKECSNYLAFDHENYSDNTNLFRNSAFHYSISGGTTAANLLEEGNPYLIKEIAAISVAVIDERIWLEKDGNAVAGVIKYKNAENKKRINTWKKRRVYLQDTDKVRRNFKEFVKELKPPNRDCFFDFIIIHQGIIDEVRKQLGENEFQEAWEALKSKARWVIITTGRGEPEMARNERLRWVEYSNLAECLIQNAGDKIILAHLLWGLRISPKGW